MTTTHKLWIINNGKDEGSYRGEKNQPVDQRGKSCNLRAYRKVCTEQTHDKSPRRSRCVG